MAAQILDGREVSKALKAEIAKEVSAFTDSGGARPGLAGSTIVFARWHNFDQGYSP